MQKSIHKPWMSHLDISIVETIIASTPGTPDHPDLHLAALGYIAARKGQGGLEYQHDVLIAEIAHLPKRGGCSRIIARMIAPRIEAFSEEIASHPEAHDFDTWRFTLRRIASRLRDYADRGDRHSGLEAYRLLARNLTDLWS